MLYVEVFGATITLRTLQLLKLHGFSRFGWSRDKLASYVGVSLHDTPYSLFLKNRDVLPRLLLPFTFGRLALQRAD